MGGSFFIRRDASDLKQMLNTEQKTLETEKDRLRKEIKDKVLELSTFEGKVSEVNSFVLKPLDKEDMTMFT